MCRIYKSDLSVHCWINERLSFETVDLGVPKKAVIDRETFYVNEINGWLHRVICSPNRLYPCGGGHLKWCTAKSRARRARSWIFGALDL